MTVRTGELVAIYGPSGSGKTTLLELIAGFERPDSGRVLVEGEDMGSWPTRRLEEYRRTTLGIIGHPDSMIPGARAYENASLKLWITDPRNARGRVEMMFRELGLTGRLEHHTEQLSMGERQRVLIARALVTNPRLVLADEPTGNLDSERSREVLALLRARCREQRTTVLIATHDPLVTGFADQVLTLRDGRIATPAPVPATAES